MKYEKYCDERGKRSKKGRACIAGRFHPIAMTFGFLTSP